MDAIRYNDNLGYVKKSNSKRLISSSTKQVDTIDISQKTENRSSISIEKYGNLCMEKSPKDIIYTIKTETKPTIISKTSNVKMVLTTYQNILKNGAQRTKTKLKSILTRLGLLLQNGILPRKVSNGIDNMGSKLRRIERLSTEYVKTVEMSTSPKVVLGEEFRDSVAINARQHTPEKKENILLFENVNFAGMNSQQENMDILGFVHVPVHVVSIGKIEDPVEVFDITILDNHEFFANGILVHNCMDAMRYAIYSSGIHLFGQDDYTPNSWKGSGLGKAIKEDIMSQRNPNTNNGLPSMGQTSCMPRPTCRGLPGGLFR
jgi:hypothetical protein